MFVQLLNKTFEKLLVSKRRHYSHGYKLETILKGCSAVPIYTQPIRYIYTIHIYDAYDIVAKNGLSVQELCRKIILRKQKQN